MGNYLVGIDEGTSGCKVCVFDLKGNVIGRAHEDYPCYFPQVGWVEQKEEDILPAVFKACKDAIADSGVDPEEIAAVSFGALAATATLVDENNHTTCDIISWQDARGATPEIFGEFMQGVPPEDFYNITGHPPFPFMAIPSKMLWIKNNNPEVYNGTAHFCSHHDWLTHEFGATGYNIDVSSAGRSGMMDTIKNEWSKQVLDTLGIKEEKLAKIVDEPGKVIGIVNHFASSMSGLPLGCPICMGSHDQDCCTLGSGGDEAGIAVMTIGTLGSFSYISDKPLRVESQDIVSNAKQGLGKWIIESCSVTSAASFKWFSEALCNAEDEITNPKKCVTYDMLSVAAGTSPIGCNNVFFIPELANSQGAFMGISLGTTKSDMARSVMEGISYSMKEAKMIEEHLGFHNKEIRLAGGVSNSALWCQMLADIFQRTILVNSCNEVGCLGAAIFAGVGVGKFKSVHEGVKKMVHFEKRYEPCKKAGAEYEEIYKLWLSKKNSI